MTEDLTPWTSADFLSKPGKRTPAFVRFSTVAGELGSADTARDPRGFAIKFYTDEGNYDLVGNNTPVFFIRDASKFSDFIHSQKRMPDTGLRSNDICSGTSWTLVPESAHQVTILFSDRGTPRTWRHMNGYSSHTFSWINAGGERFWVKYHWKSVQGIENLTLDEANALAAADPAKELPTWHVEGAELGRYPNPSHADDDDFTQAGSLYRDVMDDTDREHLATNIIAHAGDGVSSEVQQRVIGYWTNVDPHLGARVAAGLERGNGTSGDAHSAQTAPSSG